jgi:hypothetical protein
MARKGGRAVAAERRIKALELRKAGVSYRKIGAALGVSHTQAYNDVMLSLRHLAKKQDGIAEELRVLEDQRLDDMLTPMMTQARRGNQGAVDRVLRIMDRRARLWGLDAPQKIAPTDPTGEYEYGGIREDIQRQLAGLAAAMGQGRVSGEPE